MNLGAYYNEIDPKKAAWLRELINRGLIAPGDIDERSIKDVKAADVMGYTQCHWFAGIGVWSYALRLAGWPDDRPVWTGSCPCPSFSVAGKGKGFDDPRHLWPDWYSLIRQCRPPFIFGEQADAAVRFGWLDLVCGNLEAAEYAVAAAVLGAHSVGAPHRRQRLYFCADTQHSQRGSKLEINSDTHGRDGLRWMCDTSRSSHPERDEGRPDEPERGAEGGTTDGRDCATGDNRDARNVETGHGTGNPAGGSSLSGYNPNSCGIGRGARRNDDGSDDRPIVDTESISCNRGYPAQRGLAMCGGAQGITGNAALSGELGIDIDAKFARLQGHFGNVRDWRGPGWLDPLTARSVAEAGATRGFWADCDWWYGRDDKFRPIGPGIQPLAHGVANRVVKLRGYGDAIVSEAAATFIAAYMEAVL